MSEFDSIRSEAGDDLAELKQSMSAHGWVKQLPAFKDETGNVIAGHRRLKVAQELGIQPVIVVLTGDVDKMALAIASNVGGRPMTKEDRQKLAAYLYEKKQWTMQRIGDALNVSQRQISTDLSGLEATSKPPRPKGGRPKATKKHYKHTEIAAAMDSGLTQKQIAERTGMGKRAVRHVVENENAYRAGQADPPVNVGDFSESMAKKYERACKQYERRKDLQFESRVLDEVRRRIDDMVLPHWKKLINQAKDLYKHRRGAMDKATFNKIRRALHPDSRDSISEKVLAEAFDTFMRLEKFLLNETDSPTEIGPLPDNLAAWDKMRAAAQRDRRTKHAVIRK